MTTGVRVTGIQPQSPERVLWSYFPKATDIYYPLLNNDAVVIFKDIEATTAELTRTHDKWKVQPLPHQVFSKQCAYVHADLSTMLRTSETYLDSLKNLGNVEVSTDKNTKELIIRGQPHQIEWAWQYLSTIQENQLLLLQKSKGSSAQSNLSNGSTLTNGDSTSHNSCRPSSSSLRAENATPPNAELERSSLPREASVKTQGLFSSKRSTSSPTDMSIKGSQGPAEGSLRQDDQSCRSPREEMDHENSAASRGRRDFVQAGSSEEANSLRSMKESQRVHDANKTFNHFASLPSSLWHSSSQIQADYNSSRNRVSSSTHSSVDLNLAEATHRSERHYNSLDPRQHQYYDDEHGATGGNLSLQPDYYDRKGNRGAHGGSHSNPFSLYRAPIELSRETFDICKQINLHLQLKIYMDDITRVRTSTVVNAANWELKNIGGVAGALARAAGPEMAEECEKIVKKLGHLETGQVVKTRAYGKLAHLNCVLHTVGPLFRETQKDCSLFQLSQTFYNCLKVSQQEFKQSVSFPFISTGIFGMPIEDCVLALITALLVFGYKRLQKGKKNASLHTILEEVHLIHNDVNVVCEAIMTARDLFRKETVETALNRMEEGEKLYGHLVYPMCHSIPHRQDPGHASGHQKKDPDRYGTWDTSKRGDGNSTNHYKRHEIDDGDASFKSLPARTSSAGPRARTSSLDRGRNRTSSTIEAKGSLKSGSGAREPSPRPRASSTVGASKSASSSEPARTTSARSRPAIKQSLISATTDTRMKPKSRMTSGSQSMKLSGKTSDQSGDTDSASAAGSEVDDQDRDCRICLEHLTESKKLPCGHKFCTACLDKAMSLNPRCPSCQRVFGIAKGTQPQYGTMSHTVSRVTSLPGYEGQGAIIISYSFPSGKQEACHPNPGAFYFGIQRTAYLPDTKEGNEVLKLMKKAFDNRLMFTIGDSATTGATDVITWNDIHHKTNTSGGASNYGYPDPGYLKRVKEELAAKGITSP